MDIPAGALPRGVAADDIEIRDVKDSPDFLVETAGDPTLAVVLLEPLGLEFSQPVTLTVRQLPVEDPVRQLLVLHTFGDDAELITDPVGQVDLQTNTITASIPLTHFSLVIVTYVDDFLKGEITPPASKFVFGEAFDVTVTATRIVAPGQLIKEFTFSGSGIRDPGSKWLFYMSDGPWTLTGYASGFRGVTPRRIEDVPPPSTSITGPTFTSQVKFECTSEDIGGVGYSPVASFTLRKVSESPEFGTSELDPESQHDSDFASAIADCDMPTIAASAAPPLTTYTLSPAIPEATGPSFAWSGANCGSVTGSTTSTMVWDHGSEDCWSGGVSQSDATISVLVVGTFPVSGDPFELRCNYTGAASGKSPLSCERIL